MRQNIRALGIATAAVVGVALAACSDSTSPTTTVVGSGNFLNATSGAVDVLVDGVPALSAVQPSVTAKLTESLMSNGTHTIRVKPAGSSTSSGVQFTATVSATRRTIVAYQTTGAAISARALEDTGAIVPAGKSKVRVVNLAANSSIDIWRTQPDYGTGIRFQFPFPFDTVPGPYAQSDAGAWNVWITATTDWNVHLDETGSFTVASGEKRTLAVVDSAGKLRLRVLVD